MSAAAVDALLRTFVWSGLVFGVAGGLCAAALRNPSAEIAAAAKPAPTAAARDYAPAEALRTPQFWALWAMLFLNVTAGILFISNAVPIMQELSNAPPATAAAVYGFIAVFNGLGRFFWGAVSDRIGRNAAYLLIYGFQVAIFFVVGGISSLPVVATLFAVVLLCYGGGFGTMPSFVADYFGTRHYGTNYGWILLAWGVGGVVGPIFVGIVRDATGSYTAALPIVGVVLACAMVLPVVTRKPGVRHEEPLWRNLLPPRRAGATE
jgi:MFS transporter, OFA family, oxalate/formate antiporter